MNNKNLLWLTLLVTILMSCGCISTREEYIPWWVNEIQTR
jgi:hypothetical protein